MANTNTVPQGLFGPGILYITRTDVANATPVNIGYINEFSTDFSFTLKELFGQNQMPLLVARGTGKLTGKMKAATMSGIAMNNIMFGDTWTNGTEYDIASSASTAIPATPFQITPTVPNSGTYESDLGVINAATAKPFTLVTGTPTAGQYAHTAGVYTFASADNVSGISVIITFAYKWTTGSTGAFLTITNRPIGNTPTFQMDYKTALYGATYFIRLLRCVCNKWTMGHKLEDFVYPEFDFGFFADASQQIGILSLATQA